MALVREYLEKVLLSGVDEEDIAIITPYHKQSQCLRIMCQELQTKKVEVGTTELLQGREKKVILISTVRSRQQGEVKNDLRFSLGFLGNYKRTNVALSRAKSLLVVVGNMSLLSHDATWHDAIKLVKGMGGIIGDFQMSTPLLGENSEWGQSSNIPAEEADGVVDKPWNEHLWETSCQLCRSFEWLRTYINLGARSLKMSWQLLKDTLENALL